MINKSSIKTITLAASFGLVSVLSACGGSGSGDSVDSSGNVPQSGPRGVLASNEYSFPGVLLEAGLGQLGVRTPVLPKFSGRRVLTEGNGNTLEFGDPVVLRYSMYSWASGELVESTDDFDEPLTIRAGVSEGVPQFLSDSLLGRKIGDTIEVVLEVGLDDLPSYLDKSDAYVVVVDLI